MFYISIVMGTRNALLSGLAEPKKEVVQVEEKHYKFWRDVLEKDWKIVDTFFESCMNQKDFTTMMSPSIAVRYMYFSEIFDISNSNLICGHVSETEVG